RRPAALLHAHADTQLLTAGRTHDGVRATHVLAGFERQAQHYVLARLEAVRLPQRLRQLERGAHGVFSDFAARLHLERMKLEHVSVALEMVKRFETARASVQSLAGRGAEFADARRLARPAARTGDAQLRPQQPFGTRDRLRRRRDAVLAELAAAFLGDPIAGPRRR